MKNCHWPRVTASARQRRRRRQRGGMRAKENWQWTSMSREPSHWSSWASWAAPLQQTLESNRKCCLIKTDIPISFCSNSSNNKSSNNDNGQGALSGGLKQAERRLDETGTTTAAGRRCGAGEFLKGLKLQLQSSNKHKNNRNSFKVKAQVKQSAKNKEKKRIKRGRTNSETIRRTSRYPANAQME